MSVLEFINTYPAIVAVAYVLVELTKALWKRRDSATSASEEKERRITKIVFELLEASKEGLATEREEILQLTDLLKRANFEISILERKVSTLMAVIDRCILENPDSHRKFERAMEDFNKEIDNMRKIKNG